MAICPLFFVACQHIGGTVALVHFELRPECLPVFASGPLRRACEKLSAGQFRNALCDEAIRGIFRIYSGLPRRSWRLAMTKDGRPVPSAAFFDLCPAGLPVFARSRRRVRGGRPGTVSPTGGSARKCPPDIFITHSLPVFARSAATKQSMIW